jgi:hypothetical protein
VATESDAARDRVLAARADLSKQLEVLEASVREAVDIPAKIRRSPAKVAAVVGGIGFVALKGPQRMFGVAKRAVRGPDAALPKSMLPDEIEKTLRKMGSDGDKVRGSLERDFATYAKEAQKERQNLRTLLVISALRPLVFRGSKALGDWLFSTDDESFATRLANVRARAEATVSDVTHRSAEPSTPVTAEPTGSSPNGEPPTGI